MPMNSNVEDFARKLQEVKLSKLKDRFKGSFTKRRVLIIILLAIIILFFAVITPFAIFYTDALWYNQLGFQNLFWKTIIAKILMVAVFGAFFFLLLYGNIFLARRIPPAQELDLEGSPLEAVMTRARAVWKKAVGWVLVLIAVIAAFIAGLSWAPRWELVLKFLNHTSFKQTDPVFGKDLAVYVFSYPFLRALLDWLLGAVIFVFIVTAVVYILDGGIRLKRGPDMFTPHVKAHLSVLLAILFLIKAWSYRLNMYELMFRKTGVVYGAGYTAVKAQIPALWIMLVFSLVCAVALLANIWYKGWIVPAVTVGALVVVALLAGTVYPALVQAWGVKPNELTRETPYLERNIAFTRKAYNLDKVDATPYAAVPDLTKASIDRNQATVKNIRLWDPRPLLNADEQLQSIRQYYKFNDVDVDRYDVNGTYRQTMIAAREMVQSNLPTAARTWINNTLIYTHGYGVVMNPSNDVTNEGNPAYMLSDIPPTGPTNVQNKVPGIYFGELSEDYVVVDTTEKEFNYPRGEGQATTIYKGRGGVKVNSIWRKLLFTIRFHDINLLFSGQVKNESQVMYFRNIRTRLARCAPFLSFDRDPYMVVADSGKLYWIVDAYTTAETYPYSQPTPGLGNYVRNSVKAVVDAYTGKVWLYVIDPGDPVIATYRKIFPSIFTPFEEMPADLVRHLRYPEDYFVAQANMLRTYHMTNPREFYNKEDEWDFPKETLDGQSVDMVPYYVIMKIPGEQNEEMVLMLPFVPHNKQNMISWLAARMDAGHYGELVNFLFPKGKLIYGPEQIEGRIEQDPEISRQLSLWRQEGSQVVRGNLLVIPIEQAIIYIEPLYLQATQIKIPQIKRVVLVYGQQVVMEPTLEQAMLRMFAGAPSAVEPTPTGQPTTPQADLAAQALDLYNKAVEAQKAGDWTAYGQYLKQLNDVLQQLAGQ
ncbi:MAG: UPF0182 family protein [Actinomycetota bacterium]